MANIPHFRGRDVVLKFYQDGAPVYFAAKNWTVEENAVEVAEGVNGEDRDRLDKVTNYYSITVDMFQSDQEAMQSIIDAQVEDDAGNAPLKQTCAVTIKHRDGTRAVYLCKGVKAGPWSKNMSGRGEAVMLNLKMRCQFYQPAKAV